MSSHFARTGNTQIQGLVTDALEPMGADGLLSCHAHGTEVAVGQSGPDYAVTPAAPCGCHPASPGDHIINTRMWEIVTWGPTWWGAEGYPASHIIMCSLVGIDYRFLEWRTQAPIPEASEMSVPVSPREPSFTAREAQSGPRFREEPPAYSDIVRRRRRIT